MHKSFTAEALAALTNEDLFDLAGDYDTAYLRGLNGLTTKGTFTVTLARAGSTITLHSEEYGPVELISPLYNNGYMHNIEEVIFSTN